MKTTSTLVLITALVAAPFLNGEPVTDETRTRALAASTVEQWQEAEPVLVALTSDSSSDVEALVKLHELRLRQKRTKEAVGLLERAVALKPADSGLHSTLGNALSQRIGEVNFIHQGLVAGRMLEAYKKSVELDENNLTGWIGLCRYHLHAPAIAGGSEEKALAYASEVEKRQPHLGAMERGLILEKRGNIDAAAAEFERASQLKPDDAQVWISVGDFHRRQGRMEQARNAYQSALSRTPGMTAAEEGLRQLESAKGESRS